MVKRIFSGVGDEDVRKAIVVVVAYGYAVAEVEMLAGEAGFGGDVFKRSISLVMEQAVVERRAGLLQFRQLGAVAEENVHFAVVVEIQNANASAHGLREILSARVAVVGDVPELGTRGDIREVRTSNGSPHRSRPGKPEREACDSAEGCGNRTENHCRGRSIGLSELQCILPECIIRDRWLQNTWPPPGFWPGCSRSRRNRKIA